jgi:hypothetical protein
VKRARSLAEAVRRLDALIDALDESLRIPAPSIPEAERVRHLTGQAAAEARTALRFVEHSMDKVERDAAEARESAAHWRRRSTFARDHGDRDLAGQAGQRLTEVEQELFLYAEEIAAARQLLERCKEAQIDWREQ